MINKNTLFGKREDTASPQPQSGVRPAGYGVQSSSSSSRSDSLGTPVHSKPETRSDAHAESSRTSKADEAQGSKLIVGPGIKLKGAEIQECDTLVVEGRVEATMDSRVIQIADQGSFAGKVNIDVAEIRGRFEGELTARKQLIIHSTGHVSGTIRYGKIVIEEGGELTGDVKSLAAGDTASSTTSGSSATTGSTVSGAGGLDFGSKPLSAVGT